MSDLGAEYAEKRIRELERALDRLYSDAQKEIEKKTDDFFRRSAAREKQKLAQVKSGKMTQEAFDKWKSGQVFIGKQWTEKERQMTDTLAKYNQIALDLVDGKKFSVFAFNANYAAYQFEHDAGVGFGFGLYDSATVSRMVADKPNILPFKKLDKQKDERWNWKNIRAEVTQGVVQGESIPQIAKRMQNVTGKNKTQATLYARTAMTSAQNGGRQARYEEAEALGIKFKKVWLATLDSRTRDLHADLDGVAVEPDEDFGYGRYAVEYPGDPYGLPEMVYNCRCTMITELKDYPRQYDIRRARGEDGKTYLIKDMSYRQWESAKVAQGVPAITQPLVAQAQKVDYFGKTVGWMTDDDKNKIGKMFEDTDHPARDVWLKYRDELENKLDPVGDKAYFSPGQERVYFSSDSVRSGDIVHAPYQNYFHEYFHNIDYLAGGKDSWKYFSNTYVDPNTGESFDKILTKESKKMVEDYFNQAIADGKLQMVYHKKYADAIKDKWDAYYIWDGLEREVSKKYSRVGRGDLSDIMGKYATTHKGGSYPFGCGHPSDYITSEGARAREAFAEMADATFSCPEALQAIKEYFPKSYSMWEDMLKEVLKK